MYRLMLAALFLMAAVSPAAAGEIALVNMGKVLKSSKHFTTAIAKLRQETQDLEQEFKGRSAEINFLKERSQSSDEKTKLEVQAQVERLAVDMRIDMEQAKRRLQEKEAEAYAEFYELTISAIGKIAEDDGLRLVLRYKGSGSVDRSSPKKVLEDLNRAVLYQRGLDITDRVIALLNQPKPEVTD